MIESLRIKNLVLMDFCQIDFVKGLIIITGETGAGKTALTQAIKLILGERADSSLVRKGEDKARIEATFSISNIPKVCEILEETGIDYVMDEPIVITREVSSDGKSRALINRQPVTLSILQKVGCHLMQIISQHSYHELKSLDAQRQIVDLYGSTESVVNEFRKIFHDLQQKQNELQHLYDEQREKERNYSHCIDELEEIENAQLKEHEEEDVYAAFSLISLSHDIGVKCKEIYLGLSEGPRPIIRELSVYKSFCEQLQSHHSSFAEYKDLLQQAIIALQETDHGLQSLMSSLESSSSKMEDLEDRLSLYAKIKKKYGQTYACWTAYQKKLKEKISFWDFIEDDILSKKEEIERLTTLLNQKAQEITSLRQKAASDLSKNLTLSLQELNMKGSEVIIRIEKQQRTSWGDDLITIWLQANVGEKPSNLKDSTSGGELSRLLLAIKTSLAQKNDTPTIIFDEIDANVGGTTATLIGNKLQELSKHIQIFCITHFPQVAKKADLHLRVVKFEQDLRTLARIEKISSHEKEIELLRMLGEDSLAT
jgi:DNA repair protein RecN (Recombination protein N)